MHHVLRLSAVLWFLPLQVLAASVSDPGLEVTTFLSDAGLAPATALAWAPDGSPRLFVTLKNGTVRLVEDGVLQPDPFVIETVHTHSENGLLGITFDPDYLLNRYVYLFVSLSSTSQAIVRYTDHGTYGDERTVIVDRLPNRGENHVGGGLGFGPDGWLYWGIGDLGNGTGVNADLTSLASKIGRAEPDGLPVRDNPFNDGVGPNNEYIFARGFRNPFGLAFHPRTGALWVNVAGASYEQVFEVSARKHAGFSDFEANQPGTNDYIRPRIVYRTNGFDSRAIPTSGAVRQNGTVTYSTDTAHRFQPGQRVTLRAMSDSSFNGDVYVFSVTSATTFTALQVGTNATSGGGAVDTQELGGAITRGVFYDATLLSDAYSGNYFFGDFNSHQLVRAQFQDDVVSRVDAWGTAFNANVDLAVGPDGALYSVGVTGGVIHRIAPHTPAHRIVLSAQHVRVVGGSERQVVVRLSRAPAADVTVQVVGAHPRISVQPSSLTFTSQNWDVPRMVRVQAFDAVAPDEHAFRLEAAGYGTQTLTALVMTRRAQAFGVEPHEGVVLPRGESAAARVRLQLRPNQSVPVTVRLEGTSSLSSIVSESAFSLTSVTWRDGVIVELEAATSDTERDPQQDALIVEAPGLPSFRIPITIPGVDSPDAGTDGDAGTDAGSDAGMDAGSDAGTDAGAEPPVDTEPTGCGCNGSGVAGAPLVLGALLLMRRGRRDQLDGGGAPLQ